MKRENAEQDSRGMQKTYKRKTPYKNKNKWDKNHAGQQRGERA